MTDPTVDHAFVPGTWEKRHLPRECDVCGLDRDQHVDHEAAAECGERGTPEQRGLSGLTPGGTCRPGGGPRGGGQIPISNAELDERLSALDEECTPVAIDGETLEIVAGATPDAAEAEGYPIASDDDVDKARARNTDPGTSHAAARSITSEKLRASQERVLDCLVTMGAETDEQIARTHAALYPDVLTSPSGLRTRRKELVEKGLVVDSGDRVKLDSGRQSTLWRAALESPEPISVDSRPPEGDSTSGDDTDPSREEG